MTGSDSINKITRAAIEYERVRCDLSQQWRGDDVGAPQLIDSVRAAFMAGAAAMAELCQESVTEELRQLRERMSVIECRGGRCIYE